jgi:hypothetical protein
MPYRTYRPYSDKAVGAGGSSTTAPLHNNYATRRPDVLVISDED